MRNPSKIKGVVASCGDAQRLDELYAADPLPDRDVSLHGAAQSRQHPKLEARAHAEFISSPDAIA